MKKLLLLSFPLLFSLLFVPENAFAVNELCSGIAANCCTPPQAITDGGGCPGSQVWIGDTLTGSCQTPTSCGSGRFLCADNSCYADASICTTGDVDIGIGAVCCPDGEVVMRSGTSWICSGSPFLPTGTITDGVTTLIADVDTIYDFVTGQGYIVDDTSVPKNHLVDSGALGGGSPFVWADFEVSETLTVGPLGSVDIGALPIGSIASPSVNTIATTQDIADQGYGGGSLWTANGSHIYNSNSGNVGIGESSPVAKFAVRGSSFTGFQMIADANDPFIQLTSDGSSGSNDWSMRMDVSDGNKFQWRYDNSSRLTMDTSGNLGVGDTTPTYKLDVSGTGHFTDELRIDPPSNTTSFSVYSPSAGNTHLPNGNNWNYISGNGVIFRDTSNVEGMRFRASEKRLGIGVNPSYPLDVEFTGTTYGARIRSTGLFDSVIMMDNAQGGENTLIQFRDAGAAKWNIGKTTTNDFYIWDGANARTVFRVQTDSDVILAQTAGNVGVGTTSPAYQLDVAGDVRASGEIISTNSSQFRQIGGNYGLIHRQDGSAYFMLLTDFADQYGTWNALRPFRINVGTGEVILGNGVLSVENSGDVDIDAGTLFVDNSANNVGIGTNTPNPSYKLSVEGGTNGIRSSGSIHGGYFEDSDDTGIATLAWGDTGIVASGDSVGGWFTNSITSTSANLGFGDWGGYFVGDGYISDQLVVGDLVVPFNTTILADGGDVTGVKAVGTTTGVVANGIIGVTGSGSSYGVTGSSASTAILGSGGITGVQGDGSSSGGYFTDSDGTAQAYVASGDYGIAAYGYAGGARFQDANGGSGIGRIGYGDWGGYFTGDGYFSNALGIGTNSIGTGYALSVEGSGTFSMARFENKEGSTASDGIRIILGPNTNPGTNNDYIHFMDGNGDVIGTIEGDGSGGSRFTGDAQGTYSDRRKKTNINPYQDSALDFVQELEPITFNYISGTNPELERIGFIAQDILKVFPQAINFGDDLTGIPEEDLPELRLDYGQLTPVLAKAIKELNAKVEAQADEITELKKIVCVDHPEATMCQ